MTLKDSFQANLVELGGGGPHTVRATDDGKHLTCELVEAHPSAYTFEQITLQTDALADATVERLREISESLTARLTYLLEPIGPVEADSEQCVVQLRSNPPQQDDDGTSYYELLVRRGGELILCRYQKKPGSIRQTIPALVTDEILLRLVDDFAAAVQQ